MSISSDPATKMLDIHRVADDIWETFQTMI